MTAPERMIAPMLTGGSAFLMEAEAPKSWQLFMQKDQEKMFKAALDV